MSVDDVEEVGGDAVEDPGDNHAIHPVPGRIGRAAGIAKDMVLQREPAKSEQKVAAPLGVLGGLELEDDGDQILDVLDGAGLAVQVRDGCCLVGDGVLVIVVGIFVVEGLQADALANGSRLRFQGIGLRALLGQGVSSGPDALLGGGGGLQEIRLLLELSRSLGVGGASRGDFFLESLGGRSGVIAKLGRVNGGGGGCCSRGTEAGVASRGGHHREWRRGCGSRGGWAGGERVGSGPELGV